MIDLAGTATGILGALDCAHALMQQFDRVRHFRQRAVQLGRAPSDVVIVLLAVDDVHGGQLARALVPDCDWQQYRDRGEQPFARGLVEREGMQEAVDVLHPDVGAALRAFGGLAVVVVQSGTVAVFSAYLMEDLTASPIAVARISNRQQEPQ